MRGYEFGGEWGFDPTPPNRLWYWDTTTQNDKTVYRIMSNQGDIIATGDSYMECISKLPRGFEEGAIYRPQDETPDAEETR